MRAVLEACDDVLGRSPIPTGSLLGVGISFGGPVTADGRQVVRSMHVSAWDGASLPAELARRFQLPTVMENDANAAALAEASFGAGRNASSMLYVQVSTGIGAGLVLNGDLYRGRGGAGELGHVVVDANGPACGCGNRGCLEAVASGWALARDSQRIDAGEDATTLLAAASRNEEAPRAIIQTAFSALGTAIANTINLLDPEVVVVGGGIAQSPELLLPILQAELARHVVPHLHDGHRLVLSELGARAPLIGAGVAIDKRPKDQGAA